MTIEILEVVGLAVAIGVVAFGILWAVIERRWPWSSRTQPAPVRGIIGRLQDGPHKGTLVAISLDGPATVLRLVDRDNIPLTHVEKD